MFRSDEYDGGALCICGGCGVPKSRGAGDEGRDCDRAVSSFIRRVLRTCRKRSVMSWASLFVSTSAVARGATCECSMTVVDCVAMCVSIVDV
jgi:hypothetical protein